MADNEGDWEVQETPSQKRKRLEREQKEREEKASAAAKAEAQRKEIINAANALFMKTYDLPEHNKARKAAFLALKTFGANMSKYDAIMASINQRREYLKRHEEARKKEAEERERAAAEAAEAEKAEKEKAKASAKSKYEELISLYRGDKARVDSLISTKRFTASYLYPGIDNVGILNILIREKKENNAMPAWRKKEINEMLRRKDARQAAKDAETDRRRAAREAREAAEGYTRATPPPPPPPADNWRSRAERGAYEEWRPPAAAPPPPLQKKLYRILGVNKNTNNATLKKAYKRAALNLHPDKVGTNVQFKELQQEWTKIINENSKEINATKRRVYNTSGGKIKLQKRSRTRKNRS
jgi:hypothetical protein